MKSRLLFIATLLACAPDPTETEQSDLTACLCQLPTSGLYAKFQVGNEQYQQHITNPTGMTDAIALWRGKSTKKIPVGNLVCGSCQGWNCPWSWYVDPASVQLVEFATEVCDGTPSFLQKSCASFGKTYCPWEARLVELRDCGLGRGCPLVPR
jgi:hypothetical protein